MKRTYQKPQIAFESFVLTQNIATPCGVYGNGNTLGKPGHPDSSSCGWDMGNIVIWVDSKTGCDYEFDANGEFSGVCYNSPEGNGIFASI